MLNQKRHLDYADDEAKEEDADLDLGDNSIDMKGAEDPDDDDGLRLEWDMTDWSRCSQTCGPNGKQVGQNHKEKHLFLYQSIRGLTLSMSAKVSTFRPPFSLCPHSQ